MTKPALANAIYGIMAGLYLGYCATFNVQFMMSSDKPVATSLAEIMQGKTASKFESAYRQAALYREWAIGLLGSYRYRVFGEGRSGVLVGADGWLFTDEEFKSDSTADQKLQEAVNFVSSIGNRLDERGIQLIVALIPAKAEIYPEMLDRLVFPAEPASRYARVRELLALNNIVVPDLKKSLLKEKPRDQMFLKTDTHWTPAGAVVTANVLGGYWHSSAQTKIAAYALQQTARFDVEGDLNRFLGGAIKKKESIPLYEAVSALPAESSVELFGASDASAILVGTSYSANQAWGFEAALKASLGEDVVNVAEQGEGPFKPMASYVDSASFRQAPPKLVIWEIPVRFMRSFNLVDSTGTVSPGSTVSASR